MDCSTQFTYVYSPLLVRRCACLCECVSVSLAFHTCFCVADDGSSAHESVCSSLSLGLSFWVWLAPVFLSLRMLVPLVHYVPGRLWMCLCCDCWWLFCMPVRIPLFVWRCTSLHVNTMLCICVCVCVCVCMCMCICERSQRRSWWIGLFHNPHKLVRRFQVILRILNLSLTSFYGFWT
jgi:hypothetical protein